MPRAKGTLRSMGSSQLAYQGTNNYKIYGSFQALKDSQYIAEGYNLGNMIENYSMTWEVRHVSTVSPEGLIDILSSTFTIVAYPRDTRPGFLATFGVTDDQVIRVYNPENAFLGNNEFNGFQDPRVWTWDPIL